MSEQHASHFGCSLVRDTTMLSWKLGLADHRLLGIERSGDLIAAVVSRQKGDRQWLIRELLAADLDPELYIAISAVCNLAQEQALSGESGEITKVSILVVPKFEAVLRRQGFSKERYKFPFVVHRLDNSIPKPSVAPPKWYACGSD